MSESIKSAKLRAKGNIRAAIIGALVVGILGIVGVLIKVSCSDSDVNNISQTITGTQNTNINVGSNNHGDINIQYGVPQIVVERLEKVIREKEGNISDLESRLKKAVEKYKEIEQRLENRPDHDELIVAARKALKQGDLEKAEKLLLKSYNRHTKYAAEDAFELGSIKELQIEYQEARKYYEKAVNLSPENSLYLNNFGTLLFQLGEYKEAVSLFEKALLIDKNAFGENHPDVAIDLNNLGGAYYSLSEYNKAIEYYEKALLINKKALGKSHPQIAINLNNLGGAYYSLGEYNKAIEYYEKALLILRAKYGNEHPHVAASLNNLGEAFRALGEYNKAIEYFEKAFLIDKKVLPKDHPDVAIDLNNLGAAYDSLGEYNKAIDYYEKALLIDKKALPQDHPSVARDLNNLGGAYKSLGEYNKAIEYFEKAEKIFSQKLGKNHPSTKTVRNNLQAAKSQLR